MFQNNIPQARCWRILLLDEITVLKEKRDLRWFDDSFCLLYWLLRACSLICKDGAEQTETQVWPWTDLLICWAVKLWWTWIFQWQKNTSQFISSCILWWHLISTSWYSVYTNQYAVNSQLTDTLVSGHFFKLPRASAYERICIVRCPYFGLNRNTPISTCEVQSHNIGCTETDLLS